MGLIKSNKHINSIHEDQWIRKMRVITLHVHGGWQHLGHGPRLSEGPQSETLFQCGPGF